ncbi:hypothetical protein EYF80_060875 [Liparis tanakae]|uniref:Uncharacterized protein n=1 Tax=Liparis tanakae TaxID=230148 RepID=A0A4Z2EJ54_9TELE|nr:hypothetical protein EYF80_060875 [Liparis tanakae]
MDATRAPVESHAAWKPKSLLLLGFWFRLMRDSQKFSYRSRTQQRQTETRTRRGAVVRLEVEEERERKETSRHLKVLYLLGSSSQLTSPLLVARLPVDAGVHQEVAGRFTPVGGKRVLEKVVRG